jgi:hypothetical protein
MIKKSIWAIVVGILVVIVVTTIVDVILHLIGVFPPLDQPISDAQALLATAYRIVFGIGGAWLTARLAPHKPMQHVMILGIAGTIAAIVASWQRGTGVSDHGGILSRWPCWRYRNAGSAAACT